MRDEWYRQWLYTDQGSVLHYAASMSWDDEDRIAGEGETACGRSVHMSIPGVMSRMAMQRCKRCCAKTGTKQGFGNPHNERT